MTFTPLLRHVANISAPGLLWFSTFLGFVRFHDYPVWRSEILLIGLAFLGLGLPLGLLIATRPRTLGAAVITVLVLGWATENLVTRYPDSLTAWDAVMQSIADWGGPVSHYAALGLGAVAIVGGLLALCGLLGRNLGIVMTTVFGVTAASIVLLPAKTVIRGEIFSREVAMNPDLPLVIHFVLDEHIGIEGLPPDIDGSQALKDELAAFYREFGFEVFARAFSQYTQTRNALASMFNAQPPLDERLTAGWDRRDSDLRDNLWFERLADRGYAIRAYYIDKIDFCSRQNAAVASCYVYSANSIGALRAADLPTSSAAKVIFGSFLDTLTLLKLARHHWLNEWGWLDRLPAWISNRSVMGAPASLALLSKIRQDLKRISGGTAVFAHLLIPHHSYYYDPDCRIRTNIDTWLNAFSRSAAEAETATINSPESRRRRYHGYFEQVRCLYRTLRGFLEELRAAGLLRDATIILHGDHGSRIALHAPNRGSAGRLTGADLVDNYSALFAIRRPGTKPHYDLSLRSIQAIFTESFLGRRYPDQSAAVVLDDWLRIERAADPQARLRMTMPGFGNCDGAC